MWALTRLYKRDWAIQLGTLRIVGLDLSFKVFKSAKREPNTAEISVYNLSEDHRQQIEEARGLAVMVWAGYADPGASLIFSGDVMDATTPRRGSAASEDDGPDFVTMVSAQDGGSAYRQARVSRSFGPGVAVGTVLRAALEAMGVGEGNLADFENAGLEGAGRTFPEGTVLDGAAHRELAGIVQSMGLRWSIQNGVLQLQRRRTPLSQQAVRLAADTGLIGVPSVDNAGIVTARALLVPGLDPGRKVAMDSAKIQGGYEVRAVEYVGDTAASNWYADLTLRSY